MARLSALMIGSLALAASGCGLIPIPYAANVTGPITGLRVVDMENNADIPNASASFRPAVATANWASAWPPQLAAVRAGTKNETADEARLTRDAAGVFPVAKRYGLGFVRPFGIGPLGWALYNPPIGVVWVSAPGYCGAELLYYSGEPPKPGQNLAATIVPESPGLKDDQAGAETRKPDAVRCALDTDGILWFYLRRETAETPAASTAALPDG